MLTFFSLKDIVEVWYRMTYLTSKYKNFEYLGGPLNIIKIVRIVFL